MIHCLKQFNKLYSLIMENYGFEQLNSNDFQVAYKYNNFPEGKDIDITDKFKNFNLEEFVSIILTSHGIKSEDNYKGINSIHGINYMNIPEERFYKIIAFCLNKIYFNMYKFNIKYVQRDILFHIKDNILNKEYSIVITSIPIQHSNNFNIKIKTIFYSVFSDKEKMSIKYSDKGWIKECPTFSYILNESKKFKILTFYLNLFD